jgi:sec-independent protein translocase protein TatB
MFDITSSKLLLLGIIALLVVGPKELPGLLRTIGKYVGMIKRQAAEFRVQFDEAMRDSEIADLKKQVEDIGTEASSAVSEAETAFQREMASVETETRAAIDSIDSKTGDPAFTSDAVSPVAAEAVASEQQGQPSPSEPTPAPETSSTSAETATASPPPPVHITPVAAPAPAEPAKAGA